MYDPYAPHDYGRVTEICDTEDGLIVIGSMSL